MSAPDYKPTLGHRLEYGLLWLLFVIVNLVPRFLARAFGWCFGNLLYLLVGKRRRIAKANLRQHLNLSKGQAARIANQNIVRFTQNTVDFMRLPHFNARTRERWMKMSGMSNLTEAASAGKGIVMATAHTGAWELSAAYIATHGYPGTALATRQHNQLVDDFLNKLRAKAGTEIVLVGDGLKPIIRAARARRLIYILADQNAGADGLFLDFLGTPASFHRGPAFFAYKLKLPLVFAFSWRGKNGILHGWISKPLHADPTADEETEVRRLTTAYAHALESWIRRYPADWYWMHRRWPA